MAQNKFMFPNVAYRATVNITGFISNLIFYILPYSDSDTIMMLENKIALIFFLTFKVCNSRYFFHFYLVIS